MPAKELRKSGRLKIGITGGIGSGKSLACKYFEKLGYKVIYADRVAKELYSTNNQLIKRLVAEFGKGILDENGKLSRQNARRIIFSNNNNIKREFFNNIVNFYLFGLLVEHSKKRYGEQSLVYLRLCVKRYG